MDWDGLGEMAGVAQVMGLDSVKLIALIVKAAANARMHRKNCRQFAQHLKLIGNLLEQVNMNGRLQEYPDTREPLQGLQDALRKSFVLVNSCQDRSYFYLLAMGWNIVYQFKKAQAEIDRYLKIIPLVALVDNTRVREGLKAIEKDHRDYTFDKEEQKVHDTILKPELTSNDTAVLQKSLSRSYPNLAFGEALRKENEKLQAELQRSRANRDTDQCDVIQHLIDFTETAVNTENKHPNSKEMQLVCLVANDDQPSTLDGGHHEERHVSSILSRGDLRSDKGSHHCEEWQADLFSCCKEPRLCMRTCFYPCETSSNIATVASSGKTSPEEACNDLMTYSLVLGCFCYTCCIRRKLRKLLNIRGGLCDDLLTHVMCCCCALVQEWREIQIRGMDDSQIKTMSPPPSQYMES